MLLEEAFCIVKLTKFLREGEYLLVVRVLKKRVRVIDQEYQQRAIAPLCTMTRPSKFRLITPRVVFGRIARVAVTRASKCVSEALSV